MTIDKMTLNKMAIDKMLKKTVNEITDYKGTNTSLFIIASKTKKKSFYKN
jgi:hypothetical protein